MKQIQAAMGNEEKFVEVNKSYMFNQSLLIVLRMDSLEFLVIQYMKANASSVLPKK